ncbi:MAG: redoxin domain-containing protein [Bryobacteraceae bacterium]|jgi:peroxiredoxin
MFVDILLVLILLSIWVGLYEVVKQQGRILLRLDQLEQQRANADERAEPPGLPVGTVFPSFSLPDLNGAIVRLDDFRGEQVLLVHWSPECGFCEMIAADLAQLQSDFRKKSVRLLLLAHGDAESNRKLATQHGLTCPILLVKGGGSPEHLQQMGTPVAYLLDPEGRVARPCAVGAEDVPALARSAVAAAADGHDPRSLSAVQSLSGSRIVRDGLKAGTPAPAFRLPDIHGRTVSLSDYRGRRVLLVFSDPHCGPCDELAPHLAGLHLEHSQNGLDFIMIGRGDAGENRRKAEQFGIRFPVVLQDKWKLSKEYGIFATPVAFLVGEDGVILKNVAVGADAITALAHEGLGKGKDWESAFSS